MGFRKRPCIPNVKAKLPDGERPAFSEIPHIHSHGGLATLKQTFAGWSCGLHGTPVVQACDV